MVFISKKRKREIRERRRKSKKRQQENGDEDEDDRKDEENDGSHERADAVAPPPPPTPPRPDGSVVVDGVLYVRLPSSSDAAVLKKFRKDVRRKARKRVEASVVFLAHDETLPAPVVVPPPRRRRAFARINDVLAEDRARRRRAKETAAREREAAALPPEERARYVALDCEMVGVGTGGKRSALARASLVAFDDDGATSVLLDTFVRVPDRVTDFRTSVSGVRAKDIKRDNPDAMDLAECRIRVGRLLRDRVLVGHALKNDLAVLALDHPRRDVRDTARYPPFMRREGNSDGDGSGRLRPRRLKDLAKERLDRDIQRDGEAHSSVEDARAAMDLYKSVRKDWEKSLLVKQKHK